MPRRPPPPRDPADREACHNAALRLLDYRFRGTEELRRKLSDRGFDPEAIAATLERLTAAGWMDDQRFAEGVARARLRNGRGPRRIAAELRSLGVDDGISREVIAAAGAEGEDLAREAALKRARILGRRHGAEWLGTDEGRNKLLAYLFNQGYDFAAAEEAVRKALQTMRGE